jgi:glycosyltransferase involved in cell wall biosynthesis
MTAQLLAVSHKYPPYASGGLAPYVQRSLAAVRRARPELPVTLFTLRYPEHLPAETVEAGGLRVVRPYLPGALLRRFLDEGRSLSGAGGLWFGLTLAWFNLLVLLRLARHPRPAGTLVAVHDWQSSPVGIGAALLLRLPVAYHVHNTELTMTAAGRARDPLGLVRRFERWAARVARVVVVPSAHVRDLVRDAGWDAAKVAVVPHGYEVPELLAFRDAPPPQRRGRVSALRRRLGIGEAERVLVFAGRLAPVKGILTLLDALPELLAQFPALRLLVLGVGFPGTTESQDVHRRVRELGLARHVHVYDAYLPAAEVFVHHEAADVCVFPSTYEPFGLVSVEAMALGRPVVLGPGFGDEIVLAADGPVVHRTTTGSADELAKVLGGVLVDPDAAARLAARGRAHVEQELTWARSTDRLLTAYDRVTGPVRDPQEETC